MKKICIVPRVLPRVLPAALACVLCVQAPMMTGAAAVAENQAVTSGTLSTASEVKRGPKLEKGKYYYYDAKGVKIKNKWKVLKKWGKYYRYYFGKDGAAYTGKKVNGVYVPRVAKISGAYYGFDRYGRMLKGTYVINNKLYVFSSSNGKMNRTVSAKLRSACKYGKSTATLKKLLKNIGQKPVRTVTAPGCYGDGLDVIYYYKNFAISGYQNTDGSEIFFSVMTR